MDTVNSTQVGGIVRWAVGAALAWFVGKGILPAGIAGDAVALSGIVAVAVWSWYTNKTSTMVAKVADSPDVKKIITSPQMAMSIPNQKVVANA